MLEACNFTISTITHIVDMFEGTTFAQSGDATTTRNLEMLKHVWEAELYALAPTYYQKVAANVCVSQLYFLFNAHRIPRWLTTIPGCWKRLETTVAGKC